MSKTFSVRTFCAAAWCLAALGGVMVSLSAVRAEEPHCDCPVKITIHEYGVPLLTKVPYISRLFQPKPTCRGEACEPLGIDFDFVIGELHQPPQCENAAACPVATAAACEASCGKDCACPCSAPVTSVSVPAFLCPELTAVYNAVCGADCQECQVRTVSGTAACNAAACSAGKCAANCTATKAVAVKTSATCGGNCVDAKCACTDCQCCTCDSAVARKATPAAGHSACELWQHIAELTTQSAMANTALAAREELHEARAEMFESMAELLVEKGKLEAKLEATCKLAEMMDGVHELVAENAKLKAQAELSGQREGLLRESLQLALENERLKLRVAELERENDAARTAARPQRERNADQPPRL